MIAYTIFCIAIGELFGYIAAALMVVSSNTDRYREENPPTDTPVICEEQKLVPIEAKVRIPREELEHIDETKQRGYINYKLMVAIEKQLFDYVIVERDPRYMEYVCALRLWAERR